MRFLISRASTRYLSEDSPCEGAMFADGWYLDIGTIEELLSLAAKEGDLIVRAGEPDIIIYDDYME